MDQQFSHTDTKNVTPETLWHESDKLLEYGKSGDVVGNTFMFLSRVLEEASSFRGWKHRVSLPSPQSRYKNDTVYTHCCQLRLCHYVYQERLWITVSPSLSPHHPQTYHITMTLYNENTNILRMIYTRFKTTQPKHLLDSKISVFLMTVTHCIVLGNLVIVGDFLLFCTSRVPFLMNYSSFPTSWFTMIVYPVSGLVP